jgi:hypothetical protein
MPGNSSSNAFSFRYRLLKVGSYPVQIKEAPYQLGTIKTLWETNGFHP